MLFFATKAGRADNVRLLRSRGTRADEKPTADFNNTPLLAVCDSEAVPEESLEQVVALLLDAGADWRAKNYWEGDGAARGGCALVREYPILAAGCWRWACLPTSRMLGWSSML